MTTQTSDQITSEDMVNAFAKTEGSNGFNFMTRTVTENDIRGVRVWRIK